MEGALAVLSHPWGHAGQSFLYVENNEEVFNQAIIAGVRVEMPVENMFWGNRHGKVTDPFGHSWPMATRKEDVPLEELRKRAETFIAKMKQ